MTRAQLTLTLLLLLGLPTLVLGRALFGDAYFFPFDPAHFPPVATSLTQAQIDALDAGANFDVTEVPLTFEPELRFVRDELAQGRLPHWNPYARFGASLLATSVVGLLYPPNWLTLLALPPLQGFAWNAWLALVLAGVLMFGFLRALDVSWPAALLGALACAWSGTFAVNLHFYQRAHALVWLPGMLWALARMAQAAPGRRGWCGLGFALSLSLSWLAGFPAYAAAATLVAGIFGLGLLIRTARADGRAAASSLAGAMLVSGALGMLLASVQLLPMFAFFPDSNRNPHPSPDDIANQAFDPMGLLGWVFPELFGSPTSAAPPDRFSVLAWSLYSRASWVDGRAFEPNYNATEYAIFPGTGILLLALAGLGLARRRVWVLVALGVSLALATGSRMVAPLFGLPLFESVPPMRFVGPTTALVIVLAALAADAGWRGRGRAAWWVAGGLGLAGSATCLILALRLAGTTPAAWLDGMAPDLLAHYQSRYPGATLEMVHGMFDRHAPDALARLRHSLWGGSIALALAGVWLAAAPAARRWRRGPALWLGLGVAGTAVQLVVLASGVLSVRPLPYPRTTPVHEFLFAQRDAARAAGGFTVIRGDKDEGQLPEALPPCLLVPERIRDLHAYTFVDAWSHRLFAALYGTAHLIRGYWPSAFPDDERLQRPLFDLLGCRYLLSSDAMTHAGTEVGPRLEGPDGKAFHVYERASALPRAFVVPRLRELPDDDAVIAALVAPDLDPRAAVLVREADAAPLRAHAGGDGAQARRVAFAWEIPTGIDLEVGDGPAGFLVLADSPMRGWTATVAESDTPIVRGNLCMRVVPIPAGPVRVRFRFQTPRLGLGMALSAVAAFGLIVLVLRRTRGSSAPAASVEEA